jgi:hypothetical protein
MIISFIQESAAEVADFSLICKSNFSKISFFTDIVADMAVLYFVRPLCMQLSIFLFTNIICNYS